MNKEFRNNFFKIAGSSILISMACLDPGNLEGNMDLSYKMKYKSIWVLFLGHFILYFYQEATIRLATVLNKDLSLMIRLIYPKYIFIFLWITTELALVAADIQAILGASISLNQLFGISKYLSIIIIIIFAIGVLYLQEIGQKLFESIFGFMLIIMAFTFTLIFFNIDIDYKKIINGFIPDSNNNLFSIMGIIGATIVPQNLYLQSGLILTRNNYNIKKSTKINIFKFETILIIIISFIINLIICSIFSTIPEELILETAANYIKYKLNNFFRIMYYLGLMASGLSSTSSGAFCGQIILNGFLDLKISKQKRNLISRTITIFPCLLVVYYMNVDNILFYLNIVQFIQLPFAIIPLLKIVTKKEIMNKYYLPNINLLIIIIFTILIQLFYFTGSLEIICQSNIYFKIITTIFLILYYILIFFMIFYKKDQMKLKYELKKLIEIN